MKKHFPFPFMRKRHGQCSPNGAKKVLARSPNQGTAELRNALCDYLARSRNIIVSPQQICIGSGAEYLYSLVVQALGRERLVAVEDPAKHEYGRCTAPMAYGQNLSVWETKGILTEKTETGERTCASCDTVPQLSSGITAKCFETANIRWAEERFGLIIEDDFDSEFTLLSKAEDTLFLLLPMALWYI